jgi:hypothetical protein
MPPPTWTAVSDWSPWLIESWRPEGCSCGIDADRILSGRPRSLTLDVPAAMTTITGIERKGCC